MFLGNRSTTLKSAKGIEKNLLAKKCIEKIDYAPDRITLSFLLQQESALAPDSKNYAPSIAILKNDYAPGTENPVSFENGKSDFVYKPADSIRHQTIEIIIPNFVHGSTKRNLS